MHIHSLGVKLHEECLMKMFMVTLEEKERSWYERLRHAIIHSLKYSYSVFFENYKENYPSIMLVETLVEILRIFFNIWESILMTKT